MGRFSDAIQVGVDILKSTVSDKTGRILLQTGNAIGQVAGSDNVEQWQHNGFASRAPAAVPGKKAAQAVVVRRGSNDISLAEQDERGLELYGNLADGETCVYAAGADGASQGRALFKNDGSVSLLTTDTNTKDGKVVSLRVAPTEMRFTAPWGSLVFDASGLHIKTKSGNTRLDMGGISIPGLPSALTAPLSSYICLTAGVIKNAAASVFNGAGSTFQPATFAPIGAAPPPVPTQAAMLVALNTFAVAVGTAVASIQAGASGVAAGAAITTAAGALATAIAAAPLTTQSATVWNAP